MSQRAAAAERGIPRSTLQYWLSRKRGLDADPELVAFLENPAGVAFLHRLVIAVQFVMSFVCGCGVRPTAMVLRLAGLSEFVANSPTVHAELCRAIEAQIHAYEQQERSRLAATMTPKDITICQDETFHPATCLVAMEPVSGFVLAEKYTERRDATTWNETMAEALNGLSVKVVQATSDEAKGLLAHAKSGLGAHHSPDVFHVQQELSRATSIALASRTKQAEEHLAEARREAAEAREAKRAWDQARHGPGRPPAFDERIARSEAAEVRATHASADARERQQRAGDAIRDIGRTYHPIDLRTGTLRPVTEVAGDLEAHFDTVRTVAEEASLPGPCHKGIAKARRVLAAMHATLVFYSSEVTRRLDGSNLEPTTVRPAVEAGLVAASYLDSRAAKAADADERAAHRARARELREQAGPILATLDPDHLRIVERTARVCAELFQRSSSCVEGRNGQLALRHHALHRISPGRLRALTTVHNDFLSRSDGTTAAERFFDAEPRDLFSWLLDHLDVPARPARGRRVQARPTVH